MARKRKAAMGSAFPDPAVLAGIQGAIYDAAIGEGTRFLLGIGAAVFGLGVMKYAPKMAGTVIPVLISAFTPRLAARIPVFHPEAAEPVRTVIDERQLGRSEVIRAIARPWGN